MRTAREVDTEIMTEYVAYLADDLAGNKLAADAHYAKMDRLLEERGHIPHPRLPA